MVHERTFPSWRSANFQGTRNFKNSVCHLHGICSQESYSGIGKTRKMFLWNSGTVKIKHSTLISEYGNGGIKSVDIEARLKATRLTWVRRLCDDSHHAWKIIPTSQEFHQLPVALIEG